LACFFMPNFLRTPTNILEPHKYRTYIFQHSFGLIVRSALLVVKKKSNSPIQAVAFLTVLRSV
ncbi:hypothetical protein, partial [Pontibacillus halophilus]|uniref:hypothetical protein n=1 Tax=Pontibacillus halophilus TaxID=516704 RepID=UPI001E3E5D44